MTACPHPSALVCAEPQPSSGRLESWILALSIAGYPVVAGLSELTGTDNRPSSIAMRGALVLICLLVLLRSPFTRMFTRNIIFWVAWWFFWAAYLLRLCLDTVFSTQGLPLASSEYWVFAVGTCLIPALAASRGNITGATEHAFRRTYWLLVLGATLNIVVLFAQRAIGDIDTLRAETEVLNPIALGHIGVSLLLLSGWKLNERGPRIGPGKLVTCICCVIAAFTIFISASKGPIISLLGSLAVYAFTRPGKFFSRYLSASLLLLSIIVAVNFNAIQNSFLVTRIAEGVFSDGARINLLSDAVHLVRHSPFIGAGIEPLDTYPHNLVVESFLSFGLLTGIPFCLMLLTAVFRIPSLASRSQSCWIVLLFVQYGLAGMFSGSLYGSYTFWVLLVALISQPIHAPNILTKLQKSPAQ
jgi:hypothetical protein